MVVERMLEELPQHRPGVAGAPEVVKPQAHGWRAPRSVSMAGVAFAILCFWLGAAALAWLVVPAVHLVHRDPLARRRACQRLVSASFRWFLGVLHHTRLFSAQAEPSRDLPRPCVMVANHPTLLDVVTVLGHVDDVSCVVKGSLARSPFVGPLLRACGHIGAEGEGDLADGARILEAAAARLAEGQRVLIFPEGTRSPRGSIRPFRRGAFELARRTGVPVVPVFLRCDPPALGKEGTVRLYPKALPVLQLRFLAPMASFESSRKACRDVMDEMRHRLQQPPAPLRARGTAEPQTTP
jgi:1-acyl-sn-glycerol-3-phosphate acyltransferase